MFGKKNKHKEKTVLVWGGKRGAQVDRLISDPVEWLTLLSDSKETSPKLPAALQRKNSSS